MNKPKNQPEKTSDTTIDKWRNQKMFQEHKKEYVEIYKKQKAEVIKNKDVDNYFKQDDPWNK